MTEQERLNYTKIFCADVLMLIGADLLSDESISIRLVIDMLQKKIDYISIGNLNDHSRSILDLRMASLYYSDTRSSISHYHLFPNSADIFPVAFEYVRITFFIFADRSISIIFDRFDECHN